MLDFGHDGLEDLGAGAECLVGQEGQGGVGHVLGGDEVGALGVDVEQAGEELAALVALDQQAQGRGRGR